jgi:hypothetical protein
MEGGAVGHNFEKPIYTDYANQAYFDKRSHLNLLL